MTGRQERASRFTFMKKIKIKKKMGAIVLLFFFSSSPGWAAGPGRSSHFLYIPARRERHCIIMNNLTYPPPIHSPRHSSLYSFKLMTVLCVCVHKKKNGMMMGFLRGWIWGVIWWTWGQVMIAITLDIIVVIIIFISFATSIYFLTYYLKWKI